MSSKDKAPLPLEDTLRDLALLRASDLDLSSVLPGPPSTATSNAPVDNGIETSLQRSYEFVREARSAIRLQNHGDVETQGQRVEEVRGVLGEVVAGLEDAA